MFYCYGYNGIEIKRATKYDRSFVIDLLLPGMKQDNCFFKRKQVPQGKAVVSDLKVVPECFMKLLHSPSQTMKRFTELTKKECRAIYPEVKINAETLYSSAKILASHGHYGNAIGLRILGAEEYFKSFFLLLEAYDFQLLRFKAVQTVFSYRTADHPVLRESYCTWLILKHVLDHANRSASAGVSTTPLSSLAGLIGARNQFQWWEKADHLKRKGIYTDFLNRLISPANLGANEYKTRVTKTELIPSEIQQTMQQIEAMGQRTLDSVLYYCEEVNLEKLIEEAVKGKAKEVKK